MVYTNKLKNAVVTATLIFSAFFVGCITTQGSLDEKSFDKQDLSDVGFIFGSYQKDYGDNALIYPVTVNYDISEYLEDGTLGNSSTLTYRMTKKNEKQMFLFPLRPGKYRITKIRTGGYYKNINLDFAIEKNSLIYLGFSKYTYGFLKQLIGIGLKSAFVNDLENDLAQLKSRFPKIADFKLIKK